MSNRGKRAPDLRRLLHSELRSGGIRGRYSLPSEDVLRKVSGNETRKGLTCRAMCGWLIMPHGFSDMSVTDFNLMWMMISVMMI